MGVQVSVTLSDELYRTAESVARITVHHSTKCWLKPLKPACRCEGLLLHRMYHRLAMRKS